MADFEEHCEYYFKKNQEHLDLYNKEKDKIKLSEDNENLFSRIQLFLDYKVYDDDILPNFRHIEILEQFYRIFCRLDYYEEEYKKEKEDIKNFIKDENDKKITFLLGWFPYIEKYLIFIIILLILIIIEIW